MIMIMIMMLLLMLMLLKFIVVIVVISMSHPRGLRTEFPAACGPTALRPSDGSGREREREKRGPREAGGGNGPAESEPIGPSGPPGARQELKRRE